MKVLRLIMRPVALAFLLSGAAPPSPVFATYQSSAETSEVALPGIRYRIIASGAADARQPNRNSAVRVRYEGSLDDGTVFDRSPEEGFIAPLRGMIPGYQAALLQMRVGDEWDITIPTELAYGAQGPAPVGGKTLHFRLKLLEVGEMPPAPPPFLSEMPK